MASLIDRLAALPAGTVDYLGVGPVWPQATKPDAAAPGGVQTLAGIVAAAPVPCVAIGGITPDNAAPLIAAGADFLAVSGAVWNAAGGEAAAVERFAALL